MKKALVIVLCLGFLNSFSESCSAQQKTRNSIQTDSTNTKSKTPSKHIRKQKAQVKKAENEEFKLRKPEPWENDRTLLMKQKDSSQNKVR